MTSGMPATGPVPARPGRGPRRLRALSPRQELTALLLLGAAGAGLVFLATRQGWAQVRTDVPAPLPDSVVTVTGQSLVPFAGALAFAALATLGAVLATRRLARRVSGVLLAALGAGIAAAVAGGVSAPAALAAAATSTSPAAGSGAGTGAGSVTGGPAQGASAVPQVAGFHPHAVLTAGGWQALAIAGTLAIMAAGVLVAWRAARLPVMSSRYDAPAASGPARPAGGQPPVPGAAARPAGRTTAPPRSGAPGRAHPADSASMWESLSRGEDPTAAGQPAERR
ncbi:MAG TPA: Trp biosynthesis-associated membrane protein [Streptosporangiaceae bacterium]|nr:Trp biosynthesis-associated membrane protein [Streptosporangiaceae bacterium]